MVEIQQMIVRAKVNGEFDETDQELIHIVEDLVEEKIKNLGGLSKNEKKQMIEECVRTVFEKIEYKLKL